ncbi:hypothetical protein ASPWEDRAFT_31659 [Aspergillus wentii DTO 134E9]|uniref:Uncharacterized protein n=1 Tax=Aspergillus wentii DTO 134E9 TaxID=1073089 RepID=A0A1L9R7V4_ASPWE|nr:uncharacterized protein ASPWEDRAFT_31659 [Aspergillus wentii DTO 134E9]OJJ30968.1 hypothetical protein ASPWEDRAFT_31659 [Aspergillus wentii DTO 134E9]
MQGCYLGDKLPQVHDLVLAFVGLALVFEYILTIENPDINADDRCGTPIIAATENGHHEIVELLLRHNADLAYSKFSSVLGTYPRSNHTRFHIENAVTKAASIRQHAARARAVVANRELTAEAKSSTAVAARSSSAVSNNREEEVEEGDEEEEEEDEEEEEEDVNDNNKLDLDEDDGLPPNIKNRVVKPYKEKLARRLYGTKEAYKKYIYNTYLNEIKQRYLKDLPSNYSVQIDEVKCALYDTMQSANYIIAGLAKKSLNNTTRRTFNIKDVEKAFYNALNPVISIEEYNITNYQASVRYLSSYSGYTHHDIKDFDSTGTEQVSVDCVALLYILKRVLKKQPTEELSNIPMLDISSSPPTILKKKHVNHTNHLNKQQAISSASSWITGAAI